ncbi:dihydrolipoyl dehydrogenase [Halomarina halobia]|uniref:Dihydrolipoyl dehydrogenase n=1 Tax=Halomarina halobia TaxID=3033386 RepID=A0ABD6AEV3_9EURY|nr:dihydrolipoyl dehydrogenase [Halomarina sp. PSR21]
MVSSKTDAADLVVVGAGPGGYVAAIRAAQYGRDVVLIDEDTYGGTCLNYGCIPSKALISGAEDAHRLGHSRSRGIYGEPFVDTAELAAWKDGVIRQLTGGVESLCVRHGVRFVRGRASFASDMELRIDGDGPDKLTFEECIIATGSRPIELPGFPFDDKSVLDSRTVLELDPLPRDLVVVGGGYIGMEISTALAKLGVDITVLEALESVLPTYDADLTEPVEQRASELGIEFGVNHRVEGYESTEHGVRVHASVDGEERWYESEQVLVAIGREPVTDTIGLEATDVELDEAGFIRTNERGQTSVEGIYAIGDVAGNPMLAHAASAEGKVVAAALSGKKSEIGPIPTVVFTDPEIATVGLTLEEARTKGHDVVVGECGFGANGRALTRADPDGFVRLIGAKDGTVLGAELVGPEVSELVAVPTVAMSMGASLEDLAGTVYGHPTLSEAVSEAAESTLGRAIHTN